jgi:hypothetical protein
LLTCARGQVVPIRLTVKGAAVGKNTNYSVEKPPGYPRNFAGEAGCLNPVLVLVALKLEYSQSIA